MKMKQCPVLIILLICLALCGCTKNATSAETVQPSDTVASSSVITSAEITSEEVTTETTVAETEPPTAEELYAEYNVDTVGLREFYDKLSAETKLPIINVSTLDEEEILSLNDYTSCLVDVFNCEDESVKTASPAGIRVRGNSTAYYGDVEQIRKNQVPYRIKFDEKQSMLGLNDSAECKSWVLLKANWNLIMDYTAFNLADKIFDGEYYSSDCRFVHVYVNEKFAGVYLLCEQNQIDENRVDISEPEEDYKGTDIGYFVEIDHYAEDEDTPHFTVDYCGAALTDIEGTERQLVSAEYSIKNDIYSDEQTQFISDYINNVYKIMYEAIENDNYLTFDENYNVVSAEGKYSTALETIDAVADVKSMTYMYILYELVHDYDCGIGSFYMAVDFQSDNPRLTFTAPWDFNWAYNDSPEDKYWAAGFNEMSFVNRYSDRSNPWFILLMNDEDFAQLVKDKWNEDYSAGDFEAVTDDIVNTLTEYEDDLNATDENGVNSAANVLDWVDRRIDWLDGEWGSNTNN